MKRLALILFALFSLSLYARPVVLISSFDPFSGFDTNNTETVAKLLKDSAFELNEVDLEFCSLETKFDIGFEQLQECYRKLQGKEIAAVISLGEGLCDVFMETIAINHDYNNAPSHAPDNAGIKRDQVIVENGPAFLGFSLPIEKLYCDLTKQENKLAQVSVTDQTFICNNVAYLFRYHYPEVPYTFIHVPNARCKKLAKKNELATSLIKKLIGHAVNDYHNQRMSLLPNSLELISQRENESMGCEKTFFTKMKKAFSKKH